MRIERAFVALLASITLTIPLVQAVSAVLREAFEITNTSIALRMSMAAAAVIIAPSLKRSWLNRPAVFCGAAVLTSAVAVLVLSKLSGGFRADLLAIPLVCPFAAFSAAKLMMLLPRAIDGLARRHAALTTAWCLIAVLGAIQTARLATFMSDPEAGWWITREDPFWSGHMCLTAYLLGAELNRDTDENIYDPKHYPGLTPDAKPETKIANFAADDPFQYPPPFLLLPRLALALSNDFLTIRAVWFALQVTLFAVVAIGVCVWIGGEAGLRAALTLPLCWLSIPLLSTWQYGQFQLAAVLLAFAAMLAFESRRAALGGALLAWAIISKMFPAVLLLPLVLQKRWLPVGCTLGFIALFSLVSIPIIGTEPYHDFVTYHLPRLQSGEAFSFIEAWPDYRAELIASNQSPMFWNVKLEELGVAGLPKATSQVVHKTFAILVLAVGLMASRRAESNQQRAWSWIALLGFASLSSPAGFAEYVTVTGVWLLTLLPWRQESRPWRLLIVACWVFMFFLPGMYPLPFVMPRPNIVLSFVHVALMIALFVWVIIKAKSTHRPTPK